MFEMKKDHFVSTMNGNIPKIPRSEILSGTVK